MTGPVIVVIGGGIAGLVAAYDCATPDLDVVVLEASPRVGGCIAAHDVAGIRLDSGAESFATRGGHVGKLIEELGLGDALVTPDPAGAWVRLPGRTVPLPKAGLLGIPSSPLATDVIAAIGWGGALRAYLDRLMPVLRIGQERSLGRLVRKRMGAKVLDNLVAPVATGVYSAQPEDLDLAVVAPGLNAALTRQGSLSGAVGEMRASAKAGSAVGGLDGGMTRLVDALRDAVVARGGTIRTGAAVVGLRRREEPPEEPPEEGATQPVAEQEAEAPPQSPQASVWQLTLESGETLEADIVLLAAPGPIALRLLQNAAPELEALGQLEWPQASSVELATLVLDAPQLDAHPRGTGVLVAENAQVGVKAKAITHATAKWPWLADIIHGRHVLRLSYGRAGASSQTAELDDAAFQELARRDAETLLGMPLAASAVVGFARTQWTNALPYAAVGERDRIQRVRDDVAKVEGLEIAGAWLTGTGLAAVIPDAREAAQRVGGLRWKALTEKL